MATKTASNKNLGIVLPSSKDPRNYEIHRRNGDGGLPLEYPSERPAYKPVNTGQNKKTDSNNYCQNSRNN